MRTAAYARFSSDLQRQTSLEDQIRNCREYAERHGWEWQDAHVYSDAGISGGSIEGRPGLQTLLSAATEVPRPFDVLLVDDSSRVSRDLADALRIVQRLKFAGVRVIYISQGIDSDSEQHETLIAVHGLVDGLYLREMAAKIKRGLKGQLTRGFATGGRTFGYRTKPVYESDGHAEPNGYRIEIEPNEAATVRAIFEWYTKGFTLAAILKRLGDEHRAGPRGHAWRGGALRRILRNSKYTGQLVWGRTRSTRRPGARLKTQRPVAPTEWATLPRPDLRIIPDELWQQAQARIRESETLLHGRRQAGGNLMRGRSAAVHGTALFSGFLSCGHCGNSITVVYAKTIKGVHYRYYGCNQACRYGEAVCRNRLRIRVETADRALLAGLREALIAPDMIDYIAAALAAAMNTAIDARPMQRAELERTRDATQRKLQNLVQAVEAGAGTATLFQAIADREGELRTLQGQLAALDEPIEQRLAVMPTWVRQQLEDLAGLLADEQERARAEFRRLQIGFRFDAIHDEGPQPFYRAVASGDFAALALCAETPFPVTGASLLRSAH